MGRCNRLHIGIIAALGCLLLATSCHDNKRRSSPEDLTDLPLYCDYRITGDEESRQVTALMQFRAGGPDGPGVYLGPERTVRLDGYEVQADSTRMFGVYYEQRWRLDEFHSPHQVLFVSPEGDSLQEKFNFPIFSLADSVPASWNGDTLRLRIDGLTDGDTLHLLMLDTAFASSGVDKYIELKNNELIISPDDFALLRSGPVLLEIYRETERELRQSNGRLATSFVLRRKFELQ